MTRRSAAIVAHVARVALFGVALVVVAGCGVAPIRATPGPPPMWTYVDPHGRPRAFSGGVCPLQGRHRHDYPPTPQASFVDDDGAFRDTRRLVSFTGAHRLGAQRRCTVPTLHQHAVDAAAAVVDDASGGSVVSAGSSATTP